MNDNIYRVWEDTAGGLTMIEYEEDGATVISCVVGLQYADAGKGMLDLISYEEWAKDCTFDNIHYFWGNAAKGIAYDVEKHKNELIAEFIRNDLSIYRSDMGNNGHNYFFGREF